jgi:hypothetical protein
MARIDINVYIFANSQLFMNLKISTSLEIKFR